MTTEANPQPTPEQAAQAARAGQDATTAAVAAAESAATPEQARTDAAQAARDVVEKSGLPLTGEQLEQLSSHLANHVVTQMEARGAFDAPPEPVEPPPSVAPAPAGEQPAGAPAAPVEAPPQKRSFAQKFLGE